LSLICDCKVITLFWNRQIFLPYFSKIIFQIRTMSGGNSSHLPSGERLVGYQREKKVWKAEMVERWSATAAVSRQECMASWGAPMSTPRSSS